MELRLKNLGVGDHADSHVGTQPLLPADQHQPHAPLGHIANHMGSLVHPPEGLQPLNRAQSFSQMIQRPVMPTSMSSVVSSVTTPGHIQPTLGNPRSHGSGHKRGVCCWVLHGISYIRVLHKDQETHLPNT